MKRKMVAFISAAALLTALLAGWAGKVSRRQHPRHPFPGNPHRGRNFPLWSITQTPPMLPPST